MNRISLFVLLAVLANGIITPTQATPTPTIIARATVKVGMTKAQVIQILGQPDRKQGEFWVWLTKANGYGVKFKNGKVERCGALEG